MTVFEELKRRGLIAQMTNEEKIKEKLDNEKVTFYIGFDATADSLHVGHFLQLMVMAHLQKAGHQPIALLGTGTTMVGDPTGKSDMRKMLTKEEINHNVRMLPAADVPVYRLLRRKGKDAAKWRLVAQTQLH